MSEQNQDRDDRLAAELLAKLRDEDPSTPGDLPDRAIRRVQDMLSARDLIDLATVVFLLQFFAPVLDLVAAMLGKDLPGDSRRSKDD